MSVKKLKLPKRPNSLGLYFLNNFKTLSESWLVIICTLQKCYEYFCLVPEIILEATDYYLINFLLTSYPLPSKTLAHLSF